MARLPHLLLVLPLAGACFLGKGAGDGDGGSDAAATDAGKDAPGDACVLESDAGAPTWTALYADFFGPAGVGNCSLKIGCHADNTGGGAIWTCGPTKDTCWLGMQNNVTVCDAAGSKVLLMLRKASDPTVPGKMPQEPTTVTFSDTDLARIRAWIAAGAKND